MKHCKEIRLFRYFVCHKVLKSITFSTCNR